MVIKVNSGTDGMSTQKNSLVIVKEKIAGIMLDDKHMKADDIAKTILKRKKAGNRKSSKGAV